ncbi:MAG: hypothetical protein K1X89_31160 [Myxococcaceae bacterium]|nr:hypothetical protein [Myxococcaceae bacterium]
MSRALLLLTLALAAPAQAKKFGIASSSCNGCHKGGPSATTTITAMPATFNPGDTVTIRVTVTGGGSVGGLFLTSNTSGTFTTIAGQSTQLQNGNVLHSAPKSASGGSVTFDVKWTAPSTAGGTDFDAATVLGNNDNGSGGDTGTEAHATFVYGCAGTTYYRDFDGDGVGAMTSGTSLRCSAPAGYSATPGDCDDGAAQVAPGKPERCNGKDDNCNGQVDEGLSAATTYPDLDGDGFGDVKGAAMTGCVGSARATSHDDCDDTRAGVHPGASEVCNQLDDNCDGRIDENAQARCGTGWCARLSPTCNAVDCRPGTPSTEVCNGLDDDCDGETDEGSLCGPVAKCVDGECRSNIGEVVDAGPDLPAGGGSGSSSGGGISGGTGGGSGSGGAGGGAPPPPDGCASSPALAVGLSALAWVWALARRRAR